MELGDSGLIPQEDGTFIDRRTGNIVDQDGRVWNQEGDLIWDPHLEEDYE